MHFPLITPKSSKSKKRELFPRAGGGGGGRGGGGGGGRSGGFAGGGKSGGSAGSGRSSPISTGSGSRSATPFGAGGGPITTIPVGQAFAGRSAGGGTRDQVYGTSQFGSGYPGQVGRGVTGRGFPFLFWPVAWGGAGIGGAAYLHNHEYGNPDNTSRPGGPMVIATFASSTSNSTFHLVADNQTVVDLIQDIRDGCAAKNLAADKSSTSPSPLNDTDPNSPKPESAIQYYRASSVALTLDGYNNSAALSSNESAPDAPLPSTIDSTLKDCLNTTIGAAVPLIGNSEMRWKAPNVGMLALLWVFLHLIKTI